MNPQVLGIPIGGGAVEIECRWNEQETVSRDTQRGAFALNKQARMAGKIEAAKWAKDVIVGPWGCARQNACAQGNRANSDTGLRAHTEIDAVSRERQRIIRWALGGGIRH